MQSHKIGPFRPFDIAAIEEILKRLGVSYHVHVDEAERDRKIAEHNAVATSAPRQHAGQFDASYVYVELDESDLPRVGDRLEKFGVGPQTDGSELNVHEFICTMCKYRDYDMPRCRRCQGVAVDLDSEAGQKILYAEVGAWTKEKVAFFIVLVLLGLFVVAQMLL